MDRLGKEELVSATPESLVFESFDLLYEPRSRGSNRDLPIFELLAKSKSYRPRAPSSCHQGYDE